MSEVISITDTNILQVIHGKIAGFDGVKPFAKQIYLIDIQIAGTTHVENMVKLEPEIVVGMKLHFFRESENTFDPFAIVIRDDVGRKLGYVPRDRNDILARLMDAGKRIYGTVREKEFVKKWLKVTLEVFLDD